MVTIKKRTTAAEKTERVTAPASASSSTGRVTITKREAAPSKQTTESGKVTITNRANKNTTFERSGKSRDQYDSTVRSSYAKRKQAEGAQLSGTERMGRFNFDGNRNGTAKRKGFGEEFDPVKYAAGILEQGVHQAAKAGASTLSFAEGLVTRPIDYLMTGGRDTPLTDSGMFHRWNEAIGENIREAEETYAPNTEAGGKLAEIGETLGVATVAAVPQAVAALATAGASTAGTGLKAAQSAPGVWNSVKNVAINTANNKMFWPSFFQTVGGEYEAAKARGAGEAAASLEALAAGTINAAVEIGGGLETLPAELQGGRFTVRKWIESMLDEGKEEVVQGVISRGFQSLASGDGAPLFSMTDENAVVNPVTAAQEFGTGAFVGGILGGVQGGVTNLLNRQEAARNETLQRAAEQMAREGRVSGKTADRILADQEALETLTRDTGLELTGDMSRSQQRAAVRQAAEASVSRSERVPGQITGSVVQEQNTRANAQTQTAEQKITASAVRAAEKAFGKNGAQAFRLGLREGSDPEAYFQAFTHAYNDGLANQKGGSQSLTVSQYDAAFEAGRSDAAASLVRERRAAQYAQVAGADSGLVFDDYVAGTLDADVAGRINRVAKALGLRVRFVDRVGGGAANAQITGAEVLVEKNNPNPVMFLLGHEWTHRMQELAPAEYRAFREEAMADMGFLDSRVEALRDLYARYDKNINSEAAMDELAADYAGHMMENGELLDRFIEQHRDNRTMLEKVRDAIRSLIRKLTGAEKRQAQTAEGKLTAALEAAAKQADDLQAGRGDGTMDAARNSLKEDMEHGRAREETREDFKRRCTSEGYSVYKGEIAAYGYRRIDRESAGENARQVQEALKDLGIDAEIIKGQLVQNRDGVTSTRSVPHATTIDRNRILVNTVTTLPPRNMAGHEAFHLWKNGTGRDVYIETVEDNVDFSGEAFREYQSRISQALFGQEADLSNPEQEAKFTEELLAYISGDIHEGVNDECLRPMFRDYDAVKDAWNELVRENMEGGDRDTQFSLKGSTQLSQEVDRIMTEGRAAGRSDVELQAEVVAAVEQVYQDMLEEYGAIKPGEKPARTVQVPKRTADDKKVSQTVRTILEAGATPDAAIPSIEQLVAQGDFSYEVITDKAALADADAKIRDKGYQTALIEWTKAVTTGEVSKANTAMGWALYNAATENDMKTAMSILTHMVEHQRNAAQAVQATRILKKMSPGAQLYGVQRSVENLQEELKQRYGKKAPEIQVDEDLARRFLEAKTDDARDKAMQELYRDIGRQMPSRFMDKWNAWRYLAMLGNPRTHVRNVVGNAVFAPIVAAKNLTATAIEEAVDMVAPGKISRTKGAITIRDKALLSAAWGDYANAEDQIMSGGKYNDSAVKNQYIQDGRIIFKNRVLEKARRGNSAALEAEDAWFSRPHYAAALAQYCKANHITTDQLRSGKNLDYARAYAIREAQKATYRDTNAFSQTISELGHYTGNNPVKKGVSLVLEGILPFRKTPANILVRGLEYSPAGLLKSLTYDLADVQKGKKTAAEVIDNISAGLTGTGLLAMGVYLAAQGLVRGSGGDDDDKNEFKELQGHQTYALELPNGTSVTLDWLAPEALPMFVGVNLYEQASASKESLTMSDILTATANVTEPLLEMSCLQSLNDVFDAVGYASSDGLDALPSALASAATSYLTQAFPTILGQVERTVESERMTTYTDRSAFLTSDMQYTLGKISAKLPGLDYQQIPYIDAWGRVEQTGSAGTRAFNNFLNPAYTSSVDESDMERELLRLYEATGESGVLPSRATKYFTVDGERKDLTAEEYVAYATVKGQRSYKILTALTESKTYQSMSDTEKVEAIELAYHYATAAAKASVSDYKADGWIGKALATTKSTGIKEDQYVTLYLEQKDLESLKDKNGEAIANSKSLLVMEMIYNTPGLTEKQRKALFQDFGVGKTVIEYNKALVKEKLAGMRKK